MPARSILRNPKLALTCRFVFGTISDVALNLLSNVTLQRSDAREQNKAEKEQDT